MKNSVLITSMAYLDDGFISEAAPTATAPMKRLRCRLAMKWMSVAAGFCAMLLLSWHVVIPYVRNPAFPDNSPVTLPHAPSGTSSDAPAVNLPDIPKYDHALYTAEDIGNLLSGYNKLDSFATSSYTKIYVPHEDYLRIAKIPDDEYITTYERKIDGEALSTKEFTAFTDQMLESVSAALGIVRLGYQVEQEKATSFSEASLRAVFNADAERESGYFFSSWQYGQSNTFSFFSSSKSSGRIILRDVPVEIDQTKTDAEIIASLEEIKHILFGMFGAEFESVKIIRDYGDYSEHGVEFMYVYFYNAADDPLNAYSGTPLSDYICLSFDNFENFSGDIVSDKILYNVSIRYHQCRTDDVYTPTKQVRKISVEEAERLLYNGYVFGGHSCPLCMSMQDKVNFEGYAFVGLTYVCGIPFYEFYKKIGTSRNGNLIYAKTNVPAVEVSGYEEYFESQREAHQGLVYADTQ
ncbi:MAG: hypothetical protein E7661_01880 [Ruminococcaceae bacterium]|nr:hypothetical protein [Oscillospiraceae bacterium]